MFRNYLISAFRNLKKTKSFSLINVLGLAIGMTACLLILHYVNFEKSYDKFHSHSDRIFRLRYERVSENGDAVRFASCCPPAAARIRGNYPEVEQIARLLRTKAAISYNDKIFYEERIYYAEPELFDILKFNFLEGDPTESLKSPGNAFISISTAEKYFSNENPIGKTFSFDRKTDYHVVGIFEDIPANSHLKFDFVLPWENLAASDRNIRKSGDIQVPLLIFG